MSQNEIRQQYRRKRRLLSAFEQNQHALLLAENISKFLQFKHHLRIGCYLACMGEIDLNPWINQNLKRHQIYLPILHEQTKPTLRFGRLDENTQWKKNRFNITEPDAHAGNSLHARQLDLVFMPLVAFDRSGNRMGMGGGYYDRHLAFRRFRKFWLKPQLIGVAHSCQQHSQLNQQPWDVKLDGIITENEIIM